jgi:hypothetical protein
MPQKRKAGHVGSSFDPEVTHRLGPRFSGGQHSLNRRGSNVRRSPGELDTGRNDSRPNRFGEDENIAGFGAGISSHGVRVYYAGYRVAEHDLLVIHAVAAKQYDPILSQGLQSASHDFAQDREIDTRLWEAGDRQRGYWRSSHRPHIVDRIKSGNSPIDERVIDDRCEKVERLYDGKIVC